MLYEILLELGSDSCICPFAVHLLATGCMLTTNDIMLPYKIVYLDSKIVTTIMQGCNYYMLDLLAPTLLVH